MDASDALPPERAWQSPDTFLLPLAADQFIVRPATREMDEARAHTVGADPRTVIAGIPVHRLAHSKPVS